MRYRLPEVLGGGEVEVVQVEIPVQLRGYPSDMVRASDGTELVMQRRHLTVVEPPLPPEPPVGSVVRVTIGGESRVFTHLNEDVALTLGGWRDARTWTDWSWLCEYGPVLLVPDPFAESVELPWSPGKGTWVVWPLDDGDEVSVSVPGGKHYGLSLADARAMARALWSAANAAEAVTP
jgi:hypothetical protein